ncbi:basal body-orientation factor 1-like [Denticeps clupeoides]|uniref:Basal body-orientation factor 1 n=1 Tax=Denticeps clupeoides TaxID=299321 RepID=A0AAY4B0P6_9TELE|nr:basal body-orientation factor 1 [Denticeps clupeoides]XP_028839045.1 basal body-orientation factor 1 [Denticeps clupeoides]
MPAKKSKKAKKGRGRATKEKKHDARPDREGDAERAKANAALWEARLDAAERSRLEYREATHRLARANEEMTKQQYKTEKDIMDVIGFLNKKDNEKDEKIGQLEQQLRDQKSKATEEKKDIVAEYDHRISKLGEQLKKRADDFHTIQGEIEIMNEFQKKKAHLEEELINMKESLDTADKEHKENLIQTEHKFFREKARLEKEAEQKVTQLAERAHNEAIVQIGDAVHQVFKENVMLKESLRHHVKQVEELKKKNGTLVEENSSLALHKETSDLRMKEHSCQMSAQRKEISALKEKVANLEKALSIIPTGFEHKIATRSLGSTQVSGEELEQLKQSLATREREVVRMKRLAWNNVEQRSEMQRFFHEALAEVKQEIISARQRYRKEAQEIYQKQMSEATAGQQPFPHIRTFNKMPHSTNTAYTDQEEAEKLTHFTGSKVDISELTWEQKENVLRLLLTKMNGFKPSLTSMRTAAPSQSSSFERKQCGREAGITEDLPHVTFLTQAPVSSGPSNPRFLPDLQTT